MISKKIDEKLLNDHWDSLKKTLEIHNVFKDEIRIAEYYFKESGKHFWKHAIEAINENKSLDSNNEVFNP